VQDTIFEGAFFVWDGYNGPQLLRLDNIIKGDYSHSSSVYDMYQDPEVQLVEYTLDEVLH
jgi:hypothetical protein